MHALYLMHVLIFGVSLSYVGPKHMMKNRFLNYFDANTHVVSLEYLGFITKKKIHEKKELI